MSMLSHFDEMHQIMCNLIAVDGEGKNCSIDDVYSWFKEQVTQVQSTGGKLIFIGNGGSAAICSHMATDYSVNGKIPTMCFNDGSLITCLSNDYGFDDLFVNALKVYLKPNDLLIAISSSGKSKDIINAVEYAKNQQVQVLTLSGFNDDNPLKQKGSFNIYTPNKAYGYVEISHLHFCHALLDLMLAEKLVHNNDDKNHNNFRHVGGLWKRS